MTETLEPLTGNVRDGCLSMQAVYCFRGDRTVEELYVETKFQAEVFRETYGKLS
jgi:hypothetical protein